MTTTVDGFRTAATPGHRWPRWAAPVAVAGAALTATSFVAVVNPEQGHYPGCPFLAATGQWCPACGGLRAVHALTQGDLATAIDRNLLVVATLPVVALLWASWLRRSLVGHPARAPSRRSTVVMWAGLAALLAFWVLRNLPAGAWLAP